MDRAYDTYITNLRLPRDIRVTWAKQSTYGIPFIHLFVTANPTLEAKLRSVRNIIAPDGVVWVSWPKTKTGVTTDLTEDTVRTNPLPLGLVDIKVCTVNEVWSGLKLMIRKEL